MTILESSVMVDTSDMIMSVLCITGERFQWNIERRQVMESTISWTRNKNKDIVRTLFFWWKFD